MSKGSASWAMKRVIGTLMITPHNKKNSISVGFGLCRGMTTSSCFIYMIPQKTGALMLRLIRVLKTFCEWESIARMVIYYYGKGIMVLTPSEDACLRKISQASTLQP